MLCVLDLKVMYVFFSVSVWEVKFHPTNPDHLFTCSDDGSVWHWDGTLMTSSSTDIHTGSQIGLGRYHSYFTHMIFIQF